MKLTIFTQYAFTGVGFASSVTYVTQSWSQIKVHGLRHWLNAGFEKLEELEKNEERTP